MFLILQGIKNTALRPEIQWVRCLSWPGFSPWCPVWSPHSAKTKPWAQLSVAPQQNKSWPELILWKYAKLAFGDSSNGRTHVYHVRHPEFYPRRLSPQPPSQHILLQHPALEAAHRILHPPSGISGYVWVAPQCRSDRTGVLPCMLPTLHPHNLLQCSGTSRSNPQQSHQ